MRGKKQHISQSPPASYIDSSYMGNITKDTTTNTVSKTIQQELEMANFITNVKLGAEIIILILVHYVCVIVVIHLFFIYFFNYFFQYYNILQKYIIKAIQFNNALSNENQKASHVSILLCNLFCYQYKMIWPILLSRSHINGQTT